MESCTAAGLERVALLCEGLRLSQGIALGTKADRFEAAKARELVRKGMTATAKVLALTNGEEQKREFALWSRPYDEAPNPMLMLEGRFLAPMLPQIQDRDVVDIGCGTGRWLERLATLGSRSLKGIDFSPEMLDRARQKLERRAQLVVGSATSLPTASLSADVVLASFLASY